MATAPTSATLGILTCGGGLAEAREALAESARDHPPTPAVELPQDGLAFEPVQVLIERTLEATLPDVAACEAALNAVRAAAEASGRLALAHAAQAELDRVPVDPERCPLSGENQVRLRERLRIAGVRVV